MQHKQTRSASVSSLPYTVRIENPLSEKTLIGHMLHATMVQGLASLPSCGIKREPCRTGWQHGTQFDSPLCRRQGSGRFRKAGAGAKRRGRERKKTPAFHGGGITEGRGNKTGCSGM